MSTRFIARLLGTPNEWPWSRLASRLVVVLPVFVILLGIYWLVPRFSFKGIESLDNLDQSRIHRFFEEVRTSVAPPSLPDTKSVSTVVPFVPTCQDCTDYQETAVALTPLVRLLVKVPISVSADYSQATGKSSFSYHIDDPEYWPMVRADNVVLMFLILVGMTLGLRAVRLSPVAGLLADPSGRLKGATEPISAEELLESDVVKAEERARDVYRRSTILLSGGIVMAFVGVALFYVTLPQSTAGSSDSQLMAERLELRYLYASRLDDRAPLTYSRPSGEEHPWLTFASHSLRPTGMLIFMEGIAWFLLRQYRVLIEEYKSFLRVYLKRSSYLIAWKAASFVRTSSSRSLRH